MPAKKKAEETEIVEVVEEPRGSLSLSTKEFALAIQQEDEQRKLLMDYTRSHLKKDAGDFNEIKGKKSLGKPGAEKICSLFKVTIGEPEVAEDAYELLPQKVKDVGAVIFRTKLYRHGEYIGSGIGARQLSQDGGDVNKMMKMARKSSIIDAVLSTFGLSDLFTQDLEDMENGVTRQPINTETGEITTAPMIKNPDSEPSKPQLDLLRTLMVRKGVKTKDQAEAVLKHFVNKASVDELNKGEASIMIDALNTHTGTEIQTIAVFEEAEDVPF